MESESSGAPAPNLMVAGLAARALNFVGFQVGWFACVLGAAAGLGWLGPVVVLGLILLHLLFVKNRTAELKLLTFSAFFGFLADSSLTSLDVLRLQSNPFANLSPPWLVAMWLNFALALRSSMGWLLDRYWLGAGLGALGGPLSYYAGQKLGALTPLMSLQVVYGAIGLIWAAAIPVLLWVARRTDR